MGMGGTNKARHKAGWEIMRNIAHCRIIFLFDQNTLQQTHILTFRGKPKKPKARNKKFVELKTYLKESAIQFFFPIFWFQFLAKIAFFKKI